MNSKRNTQNQQQPSARPAGEPKAGRKRKDARYDLPVVRPSMSPATLARLTV
jgi:hypothetical protein